MQAPSPPADAFERPTLLPDGFPPAGSELQVLAHLQRQHADAAAAALHRQRWRMAGVVALCIASALVLCLSGGHDDAAPVPEAPLIAQASPPLAAQVAPEPGAQARSEPGAEAAEEGAKEAAEEADAAVAKASDLADSSLPLPAQDAILAAAQSTQIAVKRAPLRKRVPRRAPAVRKPAQKPAARILAARVHKLKPPVKKETKARATPAPIDTDASLLSAILLHASRPASVPAPVTRPACPTDLAKPCASHPPDRH